MIVVVHNATEPLTATNFEDFERKMGSRFALRRAEWMRQAHAGRSIALKTWWGNKGVAPIYRPFFLGFRFGSSRGSAVVRTDADIRKWLPGDAVLEGPMFVPADLPPAEYSVSVALLDPITLAPAIRLGNRRTSGRWLVPFGTNRGRAVNGAPARSINRVFGPMSLRTSASHASLLEEEGELAPADLSISYGPKTRIDSGPA
jgi:hypothetical protein